MRGSWMWGRWDWSGGASGRARRRVGVLLQTFPVGALISNAALTVAYRNMHATALTYPLHSVESGFLVDGSSGASSEEGLALGTVGGRAEEGMGYAGAGCGGDGIGRVVPQEEQDGGWVFFSRRSQWGR